PKCTFHKENGELFARYGGKQIRLRRGDTFLKLSTISSSVGVHFVRAGLGFKNYNKATRDAATNVVRAIDTAQVDVVVAEIEELLEASVQTDETLPPQLLPLRELAGLDRQLRTIRGTLAAQESRLVDLMEE
ncbi:hypothetical protein, partial [Salmonella sp. s55004]|uniref:hypothetical protein n=1 Tax=Salmonella sp. s55004 TaxID=3159675 RepID=UPI00398062BF